MFLLKSLIFFIFSCLNNLVKKRNIIIFVSSPDVSDNSFAVFDYLIQKGRDKEYLIIWLLDDFKKVNKIEANIYELYGNINVKCIKRKSFLGIYYYILAKYIFFTHGIFSGTKLNKNQVKINLWHGMPTKKIGFLDNKNKEDVATSNYMIATSDIYVDIISKSFDIDRKNVLSIGQPRNDLLFRKNNSLKRLGIEKVKYNKIFLWMPTYRTSIKGDIRTDGKITGYGLPLLTKEEIIYLNKLLYKEKCLFLIKLHPMDKIKINYFNNLKNDLSNIVFFDDEKLINNNLQLYSVIAECDVLLTDYSSVYIDYLILDRPIGFIIDDFEEYKNSRGFVFDKYDDWMPGKKIKNFNEFKEFILNTKNGIDEYKNIREKIDKKVNKFKDEKSSERLIEFLNI